MAGIYTDIITALVARLSAHSATGKILDGFKVVTLPVTETEGARDLPSVRLFVPDVVESFQRGSIPRAAVSLPILIAVDRKNGLTALTAAIEKVMDACEVEPTTMAIDACLTGKLRKPIAFRTEANHAQTISLNGQLIVSMSATRSPKRGSRRT